MGLNYGDLFEDWEIALAKGVVSRFQANYSWLRTLEFEDLLQDCLTHWHLKRHHFHPERGASINTYMDRVLNNRLHSLLRRELSDKRRIQHMTISLEEPLDEAGTTLADTVAAEIPDISERLDVESAVSALTPLQKRICQLVEEDVAVTQIARILGKSRRAIRDEINRIRQTFLQRGLGKHRL